jgi:hypothetical protein
MFRAKLKPEACSFGFWGREYAPDPDGIVSGLPDEALGELLRHGHAPMADPTAPVASVAPGEGDATDAPDSAEAPESGKRRRTKGDAAE